MKNYLISFILCMGLTQMAVGQAVWQQYQGPFMGDIYSFTSKGDTLYAGANLSGVFRSTDFGHTWQSTGLKEGNIYAMLATNSIVLACGESFLFVSKDNGLSWSNPKILSGRINKFYSFDSKIYLATGGGVYIFDPVTNDTIPKSNGLGSRMAQCITSVDTTLFCGTFNDGLYSSKDKGETWQKIPSSSGLIVNGVKTLLNYKDTLIAADYANKMIYRSDNAGVSWTNISSGFINMTLYNDITIFNDTIYMATSNGFYKFNNKASTWSLLSDEVFSTLFVKDSIFLASNKFGVYRYNKKEQKFGLSNVGINTAKVLDLALFNKKLYAAAEGGVFFTGDDGKSWSNVAETKDLYCHTIGKSDTMLFLGTDQGIFSTSLHSNTWQASNNGLTSKVIWDFEINGKTLFVATDSGPFISKNNGKDWTAITNGFRRITPETGVHGLIQALSITTGNGMVLASNILGLYKLSKDSTRWDMVGFEDEGGRMIKIIDGVVYFCKGLGGLYKSTDTCKTWVSLNDNIGYHKFPAINDLFKRGDNNLYASSGSNIYYSGNNGESWDNWSETGMPNFFIYRVIQGDSALYAGTYGKSIYKRNYLKLTDCESTSYEITGTAITKVPISTTSNTLISNLNLAHGASCEIIQNSSTKSTHVYVNTGDIVKVVAEDGKTTKNYTVQVITGIKDLSEPDIKIYPTLVHDKVFFTHSNEIKNIVIYSLNGQILMERKYEQNSIDVSNLRAGTYLLSICMKNGQKINEKFVKQ